MSATHSIIIIHFPSFGACPSRIYRLILPDHISFHKNRDPARGVLSQNPNAPTFPIMPFSHIDGDETKSPFKICRAHNHLCIPKPSKRKCGAAANQLHHSDSNMSRLTLIASTKPTTSSSQRLSRTKSSLQPVITEITGIDRQVLTILVDLQRLSIAKRMSWASTRQTEGVEDEAYCLLDLFGVSMRLIYGEGSKAFYRLQLEILKETDAHSLFAWTEKSEKQLYARASDLVHRSTHAARMLNGSAIKTFKRLSCLSPWPIKDSIFSCVCSIGRKSSIPHLDAMSWSSVDYFFALLNCKRNGQQLGIYRSISWY